MRWEPPLCLFCPFSLEPAPSGFPPSPPCVSLVHFLKAEWRRWFALSCLPESGGSPAVNIPLPVRAGQLSLLSGAPYIDVCRQRWVPFSLSHRAQAGKDRAAVSASPERIQWPLR